MSHVVWLDGSVVEPDSAALPITDPGVRWGDGLFETMRAEHGAVPLLERHLARLGASISALGLDPAPSADQVRVAVQEVLALVDDGVHRVRVTVTARPTLLVEATEHAGGQATALAVASLRGTWFPGEEIREHKTLSYAGHRLAHRRAVAAGADHALLLDSHGSLGESDAANVFVVTAGTLATPPIDGILGGVTRDVLIEAAATEGIPVQVRPVAEPEWRACDEMFLSNGLTGVTAVVTIDGTPVGNGTPGPITERLRRAFARGPQQAPGA
jgi:branched-subunit amino acid aminotransferase/4-amino-4-deoxychorismate lyase